MSLVIINEKVFFERDEFASCQEERTERWEGTMSDGCMRPDFVGVVITLKNGRKIYVNGIKPSFVLEKLNPSTNGAMV